MQNINKSVQSSVFEAIKQFKDQNLIDKEKSKVLDACKNLYKEVNFEKEFTITNEETGETLIVSVEGGNAKFLTEKGIMESEQKIDDEIAKWQNQDWLLAKAQEEIAKLEQKKASLQIGSVERAPSVTNVFVK